MRGLKILVIVLGILLVAGALAVVGGIIYRGRHPLPARAGGHGPFETAVTLPAGARLLGAETSGERLLLRLGLAAGGERILIFDLGSGARIGTLELRPAQGAAPPASEGPRQ